MFIFGLNLTKQTVYMYLFASTMPMEQTRKWLQRAARRCARSTSVHQTTLLTPQHGELQLKKFQKARHLSHMKIWKRITENYQFYLTCKKEILVPASSELIIQLHCIDYSSAAFLILWMFRNTLAILAFILSLYVLQTEYFKKNLHSCEL